MKGKTYRVVGGIKYEVVENFSKPLLDWPEAIDQADSQVLLPEKAVKPKRKKMTREEARINAIEAWARRNEERRNKRASD